MRQIRVPFYIIRQYERGIVEFLGRYNHFVEPGFHVQWPFLHLTRVRDVREHTMDIEPQPLITKDNVEIRVDGLIWVRPGLTADDIQKTFYNIDDWKIAVLQLAKTNLRQEFGELTLDDGAVDVLVWPKGPFHHPSTIEVLELHLDEGPALAGLGVGVFDDLVQTVVQVERLAGSHIVC